MGLEEDFQSFLDAKQSAVGSADRRTHTSANQRDDAGRALAQSESGKIEERFRQHQAEMEAGGAVRQGSPSRNIPVGAMVGGMAGAGLGLAATGGTPIGAMIGGVAGTAVGELAQQGYELLKDPGAAPRSIGESAARVAEQEVYQAAGEGIGRLAGWLIAGRRIAPSIPESITPQERQAMAYMTSKGYSPGYMPAEVTESRGLDVLHNISEFSLFGGGAIKKFRDKRDREVYADLAHGLITDLGPKMSADEVGRAVVQSVNRGLEMEQIPIKMEYNMIERMAAPDYVHVPTRVTVTKDMEPITKTAIDKVTVDKSMSQPKDRSIKVGEDDAGDDVFKTIKAGDPELRGMTVKVTEQTIQVGEQLKRMKVMTDQTEFQVSGARINLSPLKDELAGALKVAKAAGGLEDKAMGTTMLKFLSEKPDFVSYPVAKQIRTELRAMQDGLAASPETKNAPAIGLAGKAYDGLTRQIESGLAEYDPFLAARWKDVNFREASRQARFNNDLVRSLVQHADRAGSGKPEAIVDQVFQHNNISTIQNIKNAVDRPTWDKMLSWHFRDVYEKSGGNAEAMREAFFGAKSGLGEKEMVQAYGPERVKQYKDLLNAMQTSQAKHGDKTGTVFIQLKQPGAVMQLSGAALAGVGLIQDEVDVTQTALGAAIVLAPPVLARMMTNPLTAKWIIDGMKIPAGTKEASAMAARILPLAFPRMASTIAAPEQPPSKTGLPPMQAQPMGNQP